MPDFLPDPLNAFLHFLKVLLESRAELVNIRTNLLVYRGPWTSECLTTILNLWIMVVFDNLNLDFFTRACTSLDYTVGTFLPFRDNFTTVWWFLTRR